MKRQTWKKYHKWLGIGFCFFTLMFAVSGIILNHRHMYGKVNISRNCLPRQFQFTGWNNGLLRGTLPYNDSIIVYGAGGIYLADPSATTYYDFNTGLPESADSRNIRSVVQTADSTLFAVAPYDFYKFADGTWQRIPVGSQSALSPTRFTDIATHGDSLVLLSRNEVYLSLPPYKHFHRIQLKRAEGIDGKTTLFRVVWLIHNGEMFGLPGRVAIDLMGILFIFLCTTGLVIWTSQLAIKRSSRRHGAMLKATQKTFRWNFKWHEKFGRWTIIFTLFLCITGWALRPPLLIALVKCRVSPIPFTMLDTPNPWADKLRMIEWDDRSNEWLLSTSEGFFTLPSFNDTPIKDTSAPPVSVMGLNVMKPIRNAQSAEPIDSAQSAEPADTLQSPTDDKWIIGSFSGLFVWDREHDAAFDYYTGEPAPRTAGAPFGKLAVSGYTDDFPFPPVVATYYEGVLSSDMPQPEELRTLPMSLWSLALEVHTGRIYTFLCGAETLVYVFIAGIIIGFILWSGWKLRIRKYNKSM